jgi:hypothetical protein
MGFERILLESAPRFFGETHFFAKASSSNHSTLSVSDRVFASRNRTAITEAILKLQQFDSIRSSI